MRGNHMQVQLEVACCRREGIFGAVTSASMTRPWDYICLPFDPLALPVKTIALPLP